ncbi:divergent polysaccharide deacetylase family protein [Sulfitobacter sp. HNIBRBA3233]|uniref:divergent polysaccharide deacetylase family protein n=1 Tax=Sulfitobacter marinivivus TaxID=3158558 RepID=UPI0032DE85F3
MARGVLSGIGLGAVFSVGAAVAISVLVPVQPARAPETALVDGVAPAPEPLPAPSVTVVPQGGSVATSTQPQVTLRAPAEEVAPEAPAAAAQPPAVTSEPPRTESAQAPAPAPVTVPPADETVSRATEAPARPTDTTVADATPDIPDRPSLPETGPVADLGDAAPVPPTVAPVAEEDEPVLPNPQALAPMIPDDTADPGVDTTAAAPLPTVVPEDGESFVVVEPAPAAPDPAPAAVPDTGTTGTDEPAQTESDEALPADRRTAQSDRPRVLAVPGTQGVAQTANSRPRIGTPANTLINPAPQTTDIETIDMTESADEGAELPPIRRFAAPFENPQDKPLMSIVLIDEGVDLAGGEIGLPALSSFPYPVSFAVAANLPDAAERMARYRAEGFEVLAMVDLPTGARPADAEVSLGVALGGLTEVVGVLDGTGEGLQASRETADQVTQILKSEGLGLVAQSKGLDSMPKLAVKEGVPAAPVFRDFDSNGQDARVIRRFLDQAAFKAGQEGAVIMLGRLRPETVKALLVWGLADRASSVALAPVSAVLLDQL